ncbi:hypothetical protein [Desmospora profundinema]|uniref:Uncharacterized protein n=1 Tax=Desmospora profundinema TaxID=1571184 RepID=A0ABU1IMS8_9BACL|nr:hypothetical protein [Desmospora profundinema]MDR6226092.1 hypothetical protein [Desmospora profundinema]
MIPDFKEVFVLPFKWVGTLIAIFGLLFSSGCSLVVIQGMEEELKEWEDQVAQQEEEATEEEDDLDAQPPTNGDDLEESQSSGSDERSVELTASNLTFFVDDQDWAEESFEEYEEEFQLTQFTPGGRNSDYVEELIQVHAYPGMQNFITTFVVAEATRESLEEEFEGKVSWDVLDQERDHMLVQIGLTDGETFEKVNGLARFLSNDDGLYAIVYLTRAEWSLEEREKWQGLLNQAGDNDLTL